MKYDLSKYVPHQPSKLDIDLGRRFTILDFFLRDNLPNKKVKTKDHSTVYISVMKRFLTDLFFMNYYWYPNDFPEPILVVVGSGNGQHYPLLSELFPSLTIHLYDLGEFVFESTDRIVTHEEKFDPKDWVDTPIYLISRIKTDDRVEDMMNQREWVQKLNPINSMLRVEFGHDSHIFEYLDGYALLPPWDKKSSTEIYLIPTQNLDKRKWDPKYVLEQLSYHHNIVREFHNYENIFIKDFVDYDEAELINTRWDDTWTIFTLRDYLMKVSVEDHDNDYVNDLLQACYNIIDEYPGQNPSIAYHKTK